MKNNSKNLSAAYFIIPIAAGSLSLSRSHDFKVRALSIVSAVVNVLDMIMIKVVSGSSCSVARAISIGSTLGRKRNRRPLAAAAQRGSVRIAS